MASFKRARQIVNESIRACAASSDRKHVDLAGNGHRSRHIRQCKERSVERCNENRPLMSVPPIDKASERERALATPEIWRCNVHRSASYDSRAHFSACSGSKTSKRAPPNGALPARTSPPARPTMLSTIARPKPKPLLLPGRTRAPR